MSYVGETQQTVDVVVSAELTRNPEGSKAASANQEPKAGIAASVVQNEAHGSFPTLCLLSLTHANQSAVDDARRQSAR